MEGTAPSCLSTLLGSALGHCFPGQFQCEILPDYKNKKESALLHPIGFILKNKIKGKCLLNAISPYLNL